MAALLFKVGSLAIKTVAKPLGSRFEKYIMSHEKSRERAIAAARFLHRLEIRITRGAEGKSGKAFIGQLTEDRAIEMASKIVSETFLFGVGAAIVAIEYARQQRKDGQKKLKDGAEKENILETARKERQQLSDTVAEQQRLLQQLLQRVEALSHDVYQIKEQHSKKNGKFSWTGLFSLQ